MDLSSVSPAAAMLKEQIDIHEFFFHPHDEVLAHLSLWGDFNFSLNGLLQIQVEQRTFFAPPNYGVWLPPRTTHCCLNIDQPTHFVCIRLHPQLSAKLSDCPKTLEIQPFFHALVKEILDPTRDHSEQSRLHLLQVLLDQLLTAKQYDHYLPPSAHPVLAPILNALADVKRFAQSLQQILDDFEISERHALRLCQQELNMGLSEWRNRAKVVYAVAKIRQGDSVKRIALELGYHQSSSFIAFFKRYTGHTPVQLRTR